VNILSTIQAPEFLPRGGSGLVSPNFDGDFGELREEEEGTDGPDGPDDPANSGMWYDPPPPDPCGTTHLHLGLTTLRTPACG